MNEAEKLLILHRISNYAEGFTPVVNVDDVKWLLAEYRYFRDAAFRTEHALHELIKKVEDGARTPR